MKLGSKIFGLSQILAQNFKLVEKGRKMQLETTAANNGSKMRLGVIRDYTTSPFVIEDRIDILAEIIRFATYKNLSLVARKESESETEEDNHEAMATEDSDKDHDDMEIEFIGKRAYTKDKVAIQDPAASTNKKIKLGFQKKDKVKNDKLEDAIR